MHFPNLGDPMSYEDEGGGSITYLDTDQLEEHDGIMLRVYEPKVPCHLLLSPPDHAGTKSGISSSE